MEEVREKSEGWRCIGKVKDEIHLKKLGGKEIKRELSWRDCYMRPFGP